MTETKEPYITGGDLLTVAEAAEILQMHEESIRRWIREGKLPAEHFSRKTIRVKRRDIENIAAGNERARVYPATAMNRALDQSLETVVRALPPLDAIIQATGRLNRVAEVRSQIESLVLNIDANSKARIAERLSGLATILRQIEESGQALSVAESGSEYETNVSKSEDR